jgi:hypothetical protein
LTSWHWLALRRSAYAAERDQRSLAAVRVGLWPAVDEPVPHPAPVHDMADRPRPLKLAAKPARVGVERPGGRFGAISPDVAQQLPLREHSQRIGGELAEKRELERGQREASAGVLRLERARVDRESADAPWPLSGGRAGLGRPRLVRSRRPRRLCGDDRIAATATLRPDPGSPDLGRFGRRERCALKPVKSEVLG